MSASIPSIAGAVTMALAPAGHRAGADSGDPQVGKTYNTVRDVQCPRCGKPMKKLNDPKQKHLEYEACEEHGMFMDAGEFTDYKHETLLDIFRDVVASVTRKM